MNKRLVILTGAGFPLMWEAPTSATIYNGIVNIIRANKELNVILKIELLSEKSSFEKILAAIEELILLHINKSNNTYFSKIIDFKKQCSNEIQLWELYKDCINYIIKQIENYESNVTQKDNKNLKDLWGFLENSYSNINYYTTNYDEILQQIFNDVSDENISYNIRKDINCKKTFSNLHGSIYIKKDTHYPYEVKHSYGILSKLTDAYLCKGGNPNNPVLFSPIITGNNKSQRILDEYFSHNFITFGYDLGCCSTLLIIGYSFSDPHINMLIRQYVVKRNANIIVVDKRNPYYTENDCNINCIINPASVKNKEVQESEWFRLTSNIEIYKCGTDKFLANRMNWDKLTD